MASNDRRIVYVLGFLALSAVVMALMSHAVHPGGAPPAASPGADALTLPEASSSPMAAAATPAPVAAPAPEESALNRDDSFDTPDDQPPPQPAVADTQAALPARKAPADTSLMGKYMTYFLSGQGDASSPDTAAAPSPPREETAAQRVARQIRR